jgi:hypothetical protein
VTRAPASRSMGRDRISSLREKWGARRTEARCALA